MMMTMMKLHTYENFAALTEALAQQWLDVIRATPAQRSASFALAGGSTPAPLYRRLDQLLADAGQHAPIKLVATDERWVADSDAQSNEGLFRRCLTAPAAGSELKPGVQLVSLKNAAKTPEVATEAISQRINEQLPHPFSAVVLGMGADGHIASLFPGAPTQHDELAVLAAVHPQTRQSRMSLSLPRLLDTERIWLVISGDEKKQVLDTAVSGNLPVTELLRKAGCNIDVFWCP